MKEKGKNWPSLLSDQNWPEKKDITSLKGKHVSIWHAYEKHTHTNVPLCMLCVRVWKACTYKGASASVCVLACDHEFACSHVCLDIYHIIIGLWANKPVSTTWILYYHTAQVSRISSMNWPNIITFPTVVYLWFSLSVRVWSTRILNLHSALQESVRPIW